MTFRTFKINKDKKKELWELEATPYEKFKINARVKWRRFDTQTRGMGLIFVMLLGAMIIINGFSALALYISDYIDNTKYQSALTTACTTTEFYALNFKSCENIGVRP